MTGEQLAFFCRRGHLMTEANTRLDRAGTPQCKICLARHLSAVTRRQRHRVVAARLKELARKETQGDRSADQRSWSADLLVRNPRKGKP